MTARGGSAPLAAGPPAVEPIRIRKPSSLIAVIWYRRYIKPAVAFGSIWEEGGWQQCGGI
jgi:hypothetical protein